MRFIDANIILRYIAGYYEAENITIHTFDTKLEKLLAAIAKTKG
jgi:hypothetical protein